MGEPAARVMDLQLCPFIESSGTPHVGGLILPPGAQTVNINKQAAARVGDLVQCAGVPGVIAEGSGTVFICKLPAARQGDRTNHGGKIVGGSGNVNIG